MFCLTYVSQNFYFDNVRDNFATQDEGCDGDELSSNSVMLSSPDTLLVLLIRFDFIGWSMTSEFTVFG